MAFGGIVGKSTTNWTDDEILSTATAQSLGLSAGATPDEAFGALIGKIGNFAQCYLGSYIGDGTVGRQHVNSLTFDFRPTMVIMLGYQNEDKGFYSLNSEHNCTIMVRSTLAVSPTRDAGFGSDYGTRYGRIAPTGKIFYWYNDSDSAFYQFNSLNDTYYYLAIALS